MTCLEIAVGELKTLCLSPFLITLPLEKVELVLETGRLTEAHADATRGGDTGRNISQEVTIIRNLGSMLTAYSMYINKGTGGRVMVENTQRTRGPFRMVN